MRTTLDLEDRLLRAARQWAARHDRTLTSIVEDALREYLRPRPSGAFKLELLTKRGTMRAGVDIDDRDALYDLMDER